MALLYELALDLGGGDLFTSMVAGVVVEALEENARCTHDELVAPALFRCVRPSVEGGTFAQSVVTLLVMPFGLRPGQARGLARGQGAHGGP